MSLKQIIAAGVDALLLRGETGGVFSIAVRQMVCGLSGALADIIVFHTILYTGILGLHGAVNAGFIIAFFVVYFANKYYTFRHVKKYKQNTVRQMALFLCASLISLGLSHIIVRFLVVTLGIMPVLARAISIALIFFYSLFVNRRFVFSAAAETN